MSSDARLLAPALSTVSTSLEPLATSSSSLFSASTSALFSDALISLVTSTEADGRPTTDYTATTETNAPTGITTSTEATLSTESTTISGETLISDITTTYDTTIKEASLSTDVTASTESINASITADSTSTTEDTLTSDISVFTSTTDASTTVDTSTTAPITTAAPLPRPPMFKLLSILGPTTGYNLLSDRTKGSFLPFSPTDGFSTGYFTIDPRNGHLLLDNKLPICAYFEVDARTAKFQICPDTLSQQEVMLACEQPVDRTKLKCTVPGRTCSQGSNGVECVSAGVAFDTTTADYVFGNRYGAHIGPAQGTTQVQFMIQY